VKARKLLREYEAEKKRRKKRLSLLKLSEPPVKPEKPDKRTSKVYRAEEARLELELDILTNTSDSKDEEIKTCCLSKDIISKASLSTCNARVTKRSVSAPVPFRIMADTSGLSSSGTVPIVASTRP
jgi:hypothetical protein